MKKGEAVHSLHIAGQEIPNDTIDLVPVKNKIQEWAAHNAYTLIFMSIMFFITWVLLVLSITNTIT